MANTMAQTPPPVAAVMICLDCGAFWPLSNCISMAVSSANMETRAAASSTALAADKTGLWYFRYLQPHPALR